MIEKTQAIVLSKIKYTDNSFIVSFFSQNFGKFTSLIKIAKKRKSTDINTNILYPLNIVNLGVIFKKTRSIQTIKFCNQDVFTLDINSNVFKASIAQFIAEIILKSVKEEEENHILYNCIMDTIINLENATSNISITHIIFLREFATISGFQMSKNYCDETPFFNLREGMFLPIFTNEQESLNKEESEYLIKLLNKSSDYETLVFPPKVRNMFLNKFIKYYKIHFALSGEIKSLKIFQEVFN